MSRTKSQQDLIELFAEYADTFDKKSNEAMAAYDKSMDQYNLDMANPTAWVNGTMPQMPNYPSVPMPTFDGFILWAKAQRKITKPKGGKK